MAKRCHGTIPTASFLTIFAMHLLNLPKISSILPVIEVELVPVRDSGEFRPWELGEGRKVKAIDNEIACPSDEIRNDGNGDELRLGTEKVSHDDCRETRHERKSLGEMSKR